MFSRTWARIAVSYAALILATVGVLAFLLGGEFERREEAALRVRLTDQARLIAQAAAPLLGPGASPGAANSLAHDLARVLGTRVTLIRPDGVVVGDSEEQPAGMENHASRPEVAAVLADPRSVGSSTRLSATVNRRLLYLAVGMAGPADSSRLVGVARVAYPLTAVEEAHNTLFRNLLLAVLLVSLPAVLLGTLLVRSLAGPLSDLRRTARQFGQGDLLARATLPSGGEIGELGREFDSMADRLATTISQRTSERNQMAAVLSHMHDGIITTDARGRIESINPAAAQILGTNAERSVGHSLIEVTHSHELHNAVQVALAAPDERHRYEVRVGSRTLAVVATRVPPPDAHNQHTALVVLHDITDLRHLEGVRRDFVANIGHELRTPLASVKLLVETATGVLYEDPGAAGGFLEQVDTELDRLTQLVRELLELSRIESGQVKLQLAQVAVPELLERTVARLRSQAQRAGVDLSVEADSALPQARIDSERVEHVLINLLHNAIKFTNPGGTIRLRAERKDQYIEISVADTGVGIPPEDLNRIFERFYKVDKARVGSAGGETGTGLGLAIAKHIVQAHGGRIWADSTYGVGSTLYFTLPIERK
ncbi:MAG TPA: ATP-binding protein [Chloroflexia bacterium]|jgi:two-component system phosphate regulon sensor histidine kinase PhoR